MQRRTNCLRSKIPSATTPSRSNKSINNNEISSGSSSNMRKPLSDLTNFNLIPTHTLRKLLSSNSISHSETQSLLRKSRTSVIPIYQNPPNSAPHKPYNNPNSNARSGTSVGSSNFNNDPKTTAQNPSPIRPQLSPFSSANPGDKSNKLVIYSRRRGQRKADVLPKSSTPVEKTKNEGKAISVPLSSTPAEKAKDDGKAIAVPFDYIAAEKARIKGKVIAVPFDSTSAGNLRGKEKEISAPFRSSNVEKTRDKGKEIYVPFSSTPVEKMRDKGKAIAVPINCILEEVEDKRRSTAVLINSRPKKKQKEKRQADTMVYSCPPLLRTSNIGNELNQAGDIMLSKSWTGPHRKQKKRKCSEKQCAFEGSLPPEYVKQMNAYFEEVDAFELPVEEVSDHDMD